MVKYSNMSPWPYHGEDNFKFSHQCKCCFCLKLPLHWRVLEQEFIENISLVFVHIFMLFFGMSTSILDDTVGGNWDT